ncbi:MAG: RagB/SusD family nutrient uptake outer membrane protein [Bacteroidota bacterium]|nr:RagB/SusD family nutrient uptake outer membrane protein [Bacteroidota bacterium]
MKKILNFLIGVGLLGGVYSCQETFLQKPDTSGTVNLDKVYSSALNAKAALLYCYRNVLIQGWPGGIGIGHGALASISGERYRGYNWHGTYTIANAGLTPNGTDGSDGGADNFGTNWTCIRSCFLVYQNIDKVPDMDANTKATIKAECKGLIAYRYMNMFFRYGGVPIVTKAFDPSDNLNIKRATLQETLDYTLKLCDEAIAGLPEKWTEDQTGRLTKGAVMAMKSKLLMFAARPLFNSATPYLDFGSNNNLICFGNADPERWKTAIDANEAVLTWAATNGYKLINTGAAGAGNPNPNAGDDYGTACSTPGNPEVILAFKWDNASSGNFFIFYYLNTSPYWSNSRYDTDQVGLLSNFLSNYWRNDGKDESWPSADSIGARKAADWIARVNRLEPRFLIDNNVPGVGSKSNPGDNNWNNVGWGRTLGNFTTSAYPASGGNGRGCGNPTKFYYHAYSRTWFEAPLFRMAEIYLNLAEAYNEYGNTTKALENLNYVHNRAGLPAITETDKVKLRAIIQREWAVEYYNESHRYYDVKHWKLSDIGNGIIGGQMREMTWQCASSNQNLAANEYYYWDTKSYVAFWSAKMFLEPIPQSEINKGILIQNPGY